MNIIGTALENLKKENPKKSPKVIMKLTRRSLSKHPHERSRRDRKVLLDFSIALFDVLIPEQMLDSIIKAIEPKIRKRLLTVRVLVVCFIVYQLSPEIKSYNDLIRELTIRLSHKLPRDVLRILAKSSLSYQLSVRNPAIFRAILFYMLNAVIPHCGNKQIRDIPYTIKAIDCSSFNVVQSLKNEFGTVKNQYDCNQTQCRMHTVFNITKRMVENIMITDAITNEKQPIREFFESIASLSKNIIWVCDLGYWAFWIMDTIIDRKQHFVFRLRENTTRKIITVINEEQQDYLVILGCPTSRAPYPMHNMVRLVACPQEGSEIYWYVTSLIDPNEFNAAEIRAFYRSRWHIEIFFRDIKHVLEFKPMAHSKNGVEIQFYGALITYALVRTIMHDASAEHDIAIEDISFSESYQLINSFLRKKHRVFAEASVDVAMREYFVLLKLIAKSCINETAKKRSATSRKRKNFLLAA